MVTPIRSFEVTSGEDSKKLYCTQGTKITYQNSVFGDDQNEIDRKDYDALALLMSLDNCADNLTEKDIRRAIRYAKKAEKAAAKHQKNVNPLVSAMSHFGIKINKVKERGNKGVYDITIGENTFHIDFETKGEARKRLRQEKRQELAKIDAEYYRDINANDKEAQLADQEYKEQHKLFSKKIRKTKWQKIMPHANKDSLELARVGYAQQDSLLTVNHQQKIDSLETAREQRSEEYEVTRRKSKDSINALIKNGLYDNSKATNADNLMRTLQYENSDLFDIELEKNFFVITLKKDVEAGSLSATLKLDTGKYTRFDGYTCSALAHYNDNVQERLENSDGDINNPDDKTLKKGMRIRIPATDVRITAEL